jgi:bifunctional DNA-binding transcriptional regulator/antitoxin component of YhaV-PrlF toxin-antitoxin module
MKEFIKRKVDDLGRITLPIEFRRTLGIEVQDKVNVQFKDNGIYVFKQTEQEILNSKLDDVILAVSECKEIDDGEVATVVSILSKLVKEGAE